MRMLANCGDGLAQSHILHSAATNGSSHTSSLGQLTKTMLRVNTLVWILLLSAGAFCEEHANGCDLKPCQNGGLCESQQGDYICHCSQERQSSHLYGGQNCTVALVGCKGDRCQNGGTCSPYLSNGRHRYSCACPGGFMGPKCQTPTTFSFETGGRLHVQTPLASAEAPLNITLSFRTKRHDGTLFQRRVGHQLLTLELVEGRLRHSLLGGRGSGAVLQELPRTVADGQWHTAEASLLSGALGLRLRDAACAEGTCRQETPTGNAEERAEASPPELDSGPAEPRVRRSLFVGGKGPSDPVLHFIGCMRDLYVESRLAVPGAGAAAETNVTLGCSDRDSCEDSPCQSRGRCISRGWRSYACECRRPYEGENCLEEYVTARFGNGDSESYAVFSLDDHPGDRLVVSMFVRTRQPQGLLLVLANSTSRYLRLWLEGGKVKVQVDNSESLLGRGQVSDGHFHLVTVRIEGGSLTLLQSARSQGSVAVRGVGVQAGDLVYTGGLPDRRTSAAFGGYFKGCIQDLRVDSRRLQFYPIATPVSAQTPQSLVHVTRGCASDNSCGSNPCLNGGECYSMWEEFTCNCPPNTAGRRCEEVKWCELFPCPSTAACQSHSQGFECVSNVTLRDKSPAITYRGNGRIRRRLSNVSLRVRTRRHNATLLHAERDSAFVTISIQNSRLVLELQGGDGSPRLTVKSWDPVSDGRWHAAELAMEDPALQASRWSMVLDEDREEASVSATASGPLDFLREEVDILLGGLGPEAGGNLAGCLGSVEIGSLSLPFYADTELKLPRPQEEQFVRTSGPPRYGCWGSDVCSPDPCQHRGACQDFFDLFRCECLSGWWGPSCETTADTCASEPCVHGNCSDRPAGYECACEPGFKGERCEAEVDVDVCTDNKCGPGATCLRGLKHYACLCPKTTTGPFCREMVPEIPWYIEKIPYPQLAVSICGNNKRHYNCFNGGNCSSVEDMCHCLPGFTGQWCEQEVDECASDPCKNGGFCHNLINKFHCVCEISFSGDYCQFDISDFYLYVFLLLWQNIFQLLSYLILRIDDDPTVEWGPVYED